MNKKLILVCLVMMAIVFSGCSSQKGDKNQEMAKDNSNTKQNMEDDDSDYIVDNVKWPSNIPSIVPEFTYGKNAGIITNREDGTQWIIAFGNVPNDASEKYKADLDSKGWETNFMGDTLVAEYGDEEYTITFSYFKETHGAQLNIVKNKK